MLARVALIEPHGSAATAVYTYCLCRALASRGVHVVLLTTRTYELADLPRRFPVYPILPEWSGADTHAVPPGVRGYGQRLKRAWRFLKSAHTMLWIIAITLSERVSVVHLQWPIDRNDWMYLAVLRLLGRRIIYTAHNVLPHEHTQADVLRLRKLLAHVDHVILHARENDRVYRGIFGEGRPPSCVIPHGNYTFYAERNHDSPLQARAAIGVPPASRVVLFFGMIRPYKGLTDLISAFGHVRRCVPDSWLVVAGTPLEDFGPYEEAIAAANIGRCTALHLRYQAIGDVAKFLRAADVVVLPYRSTSQSGVAFLAFAFGVPVIATRVGGLPEIIEDGQTGLLVPPGDDRALAEAIIRLLTDATLRRDLGLRAAEIAASRYSWDRIAEMTLGVYNMTRRVGSRGVPSPE